MNSFPPSPSVLAPVSTAIERAREILFRPFDLGRWLAIGFCAWLATLGEGGFGGGGGGGDWRSGGNPRRELERAGEYIRENLNWLIPLAVFVVAAAIVVVLLVLWLSSRGRFMFLDNVATNRAEVVAPWKAWRAHGNSLFLFRFVLGLIGFAVMAPFLILVVFAGIAMVRRQGVEPGPLLLLVAGGLAAAVIGIVFAVIEKFTKDFVVPIMWLRTPSCLSAWGEFFRLLSANPGHFIVYILFHVVLSIAIGIGLLATVIATCCVAGCLMAIPYLGTVLLLPVLVFLRAYSLHYLAQYGPAYDVFAQPAGDGFVSEPGETPA